MEDVRIPVPDETGDIVRNRFEDFLKTFSIPHEGDDITQQKFLDDYMVQISNMVRFNKSTVYVNFLHLQQYDPELADALLLEYYRFEPYLRHAVHNIVAADNQHYVYDVDRGQREFFVSFYNLPTVERIRTVRTAKIGGLMSVCGTVTRTSEVRPELFYGSFQCRKCGTMHPGIEQQFQYTEPPVCKNTQCQKAGSFQLVLNKSSFIDWQRLRVQENSDEIPAGSMPRSLDVICRNEAVEMAKAGDKVMLTGTVAVVPDASGLARVGESTVSSKGGRGDNGADGVTGLKKLGVREMTYKMVFLACSVQVNDQRSAAASTDAGTNSSNNNILPYFHEMVANPDEVDADGNLIVNSDDKNDAQNPITFTEADYQMIEQMYKTPQLYNQMAESICPTVFGHMEVKRGVLLMLLGGVHKKTIEGISLRGDINVCIVGDPSCAKSQFLKYVHQFLPRTVYTAGKSSSAAGLTASVVRDVETGEFCVEAGALMLADNGICCIDEFDKMDSADQVAIHEAMEQQTISITKAGIQATLNARTSILAAANPVFGRYDRTKTLKANIAISAAIMSRFDLFFIILDECNPKVDALIAQHIVANHGEAGMQSAQQQAPFSRVQLQKYIAFARTLHPAFNAASRNALVECYRLLRSNDILGKNKTAYRITVRQLESLVRLSEALARLHLDPEVKEVYVKEAYRLLQRSIIFVEAEDIELEIEDDNDDDPQKDVNHTMEVSAEDEAAFVQAAEEAERQEQEAKAQAQIEGEVDAMLQHATEMEEAQDATYTEGTIAKSVTKPKAATTSTSLKPTTKTHISSKEYEDMTQLLLLHLKQAEDHYHHRQAQAQQVTSSSTSSDPSSSGNGGGQVSEVDKEAGDDVYLPFGGVQWGELVTWYLQTMEPHLVPPASVDGDQPKEGDQGSETGRGGGDGGGASTVDEEERQRLLVAYQQRRKVVSQVIRRCIKHDGLIVALLPPSSSSSAVGGASEEKVNNEEKMLKLHPSALV